MNMPLWKPLPSKTRIYESLYTLNRGFEITLLSIECLERLGIFRLEELNAFKVSLELTRAEANEELTQTLQEYELEQSAQFDKMERQWEDRRKDPDDVFIQARNRKQEVKEQIKNLQKSLSPQKSRRSAKKKGR
jgi:hypothetical protein